MQKYSTYKPSNVEWLGDVPTNWKVDKLKNYCDIFASNVDKKIEDGEIEVSLCNYLDVYKNEKIDRSIDFMIASATQAEIEKFTLQLNDIILTKDSETPDDIAVPAIVKEVFENFLCGYHLSIIRCQKKIEPDFLIWALRDLYIATQFHREAVGITRFGLASKHFKNGIFAIPSRTEQTAIAAYLDQATANIDKVIATKQKQLEKLEQYNQSKIHECVTKGLNPNVTLKPSGIEWIGDVPSHWKVEKLKQSVEVKDGTHDTPDYEEEGIDNYPFVTSKDIHGNEIDFSATKFISAEFYISYDSRSNVRMHDIIMPMIGTIGNSAIVKTEKQFAIKNVALFKTSEAVKILPNYLFYYLESDFNKMQFEITSKGGVQSFMSLSSLRNLYFLRPPLGEQKELALYLDSFYDSILKEKNIINQQIEKLKQYRKCLIHECVTGKRKVIND